MSTPPHNADLYRISNHPTGLSDEELFGRCTMTRGRSGGPGGQHRNRVATLVQLRYEPASITLQAGERRSAEVNRRVALHRLRLVLAVEVRTPVAPGEARTALWVSRCTKDGKIRCSARHHDHAILIAEALDVIAACQWDMPKAAIRLCCSKTQLVKLLGAYPPALLKVNDHRKARGEHPLHNPK